MKELQESSYCENCEKNTIHVIKEYAMEVEYTCTECESKEDVVKTFF